MGTWRLCKIDSSHRDTVQRVANTRTLFGSTKACTKQSYVYEQVVCRWLRRRCKKKDNPGQKKFRRCGPPTSDYCYTSKYECQNFIARRFITSLHRPEISAARSNISSNTRKEPLPYEPRTCPVVGNMKVLCLRRTLLPKLKQAPR